MTSSSTYAFNPALSNLVLSSFARIGIRRTEITAQHMADADVESNMVQVALGNRNPNIWTQELYPITLVEGTATYDLPGRMIAIRDAYMSVTVNSTTTDRVLWPLGVADYDAQSNKTLRAVPTAYFVNKQIAPTVTMWPVPDDSADFVLNVRLLSQIQDALIPSGVTLNVPYRFLDVFVAGLAYRLARIYARDLEAVRKQDYADAWTDAATTDTEDNVNIGISPTFSGYFR